MGLDVMIKFGYCLIVVTFLLMFWASSIGARDIHDPGQYPPCTFNPLCRCSKAQPDLGIVQCKNVPFSAIPRTINSSKVFRLNMDNTGLERLEPNFLSTTGLYHLEIRNNFIANIPDDSFVGLDRSLWELYLTYNELIEVPTKALRYLQKLKILDLSGNKISSIERESWRGLEDTLQVLSLRDNYLSNLPADGFSGLLVLDSLDLSGNNLRTIDGSVFRDGMNRLSKLILSDNLLTAIPYEQISPLRALRILDISHNEINEIVPQTGPTIEVQLNLDTLHLDFNKIETIPSASFKLFQNINRTFLDGNPIHSIEEDAFRSARIKELYLRHCGLSTISPLAFGGLENSLQVLDLSGNKISNTSEKLFKNFDYLRSLNLNNNLLKSIIPRESFNGFLTTLTKLDLSGDGNAATNLQELKRMRSLRTLSVSKIATDKLQPEDFLEFGNELEDLKISQGGLKTIFSNTFKYVRGLKRIDLSENRISKIEDDAFREIEHSLIALKMAHALSPDYHTLSGNIFKPMSSLQLLDMSNNRIKSIPETSFHFMKSIRALEFRDNQIEQIAKGIFQGDIHSKLETISFAYNAIKYVSQHTFVDLGCLKTLNLDDNRIEKIERRGFMNLDQLKTLSLRGNKISSISDESFQNLPELETMDLAYNSLNYFDFDYLDQVGTLSSLTVNISHNQINALLDNSSNFGFTKDHSFYHSNIKILDLSSNNISDIQSGYFKPVEISLTHLYLSKNKLYNISRVVFGNLMHLQWLDLSDNLLVEMDHDTFRNTRKLQFLNLARNEISEVPSELFKFVTGLRIIDLSSNHLRLLTENLFFNEGLERLNLANNQLTKIPVTSITNLAALSVCDIDLSNNHIGAIHSADLSNKFRSLNRLDLSNNRLVRLEDAAFATLPHLMHLNLGHNSELEVTGKAFIGLENSLLHLNLDNVSITAFPELPLPFLRRLTIADNELPFVPPELATNMTSLNSLDLSYNDLTNVPLLTHSLPRLRHLSLAGNPISVLTNTSLIGAAETLKELDISNLQLNSFETGALNKMTSLKSLTISCFPQVNQFNIPRILEGVQSLRTLRLKSFETHPQSSHSSSISNGNGMENVHVPQSVAPPPAPHDCDFKREMDGKMPKKLSRVEIVGSGIKKLGENLFSGIQSEYLQVVLINTSISSLPTNLFSQLGGVKNISLDFSGNNNQLKSVPNPNTASVIHLPEKVFLTSLRMGSNSLDCDCSIGWIEFWNRKKRQFLCSSQSWSQDLFGTHFYDTHRDEKTSEICEDTEHGQRQATCSNKKNENLVEVLKKELECGWGSGSETIQKASLLIVLSLVFLIWF